MSGGQSARLARTTSPAAMADDADVRLLRTGFVTDKHVLRNLGRLFLPIAHQDTLFLFLAPSAMTLSASGKGQ